MNQDQKTVTNIPPGYDPTCILCNMRSDPGCLKCLESREQKTGNACAGHRWPCGKHPVAEAAAPSQPSAAPQDTVAEFADETPTPPVKSVASAGPSQPQAAEPEPTELTRHDVMVATASDPKKYLTDHGAMTRMEFLKSLIPPDLVNQKRWIGWKAVLEEGKTKVTKKPYSPVDGSPRGAVKKNQQHFLTFAEAYLGVVKYELDGIGYVFLEDGFVGIDLDNCVSDGKLKPTVENFWLKFFERTYVEFSPSCTGIHIICRGKIPKAIKAELHDAPGVKVELYKDARFFTWTTLRALSSDSRLGEVMEIADCQIGIDKLIKELGAEPSSAETQMLDESEEAPGLTKKEIKRIYGVKLLALRSAKEGEGNGCLNDVGYFAGGAAAADPSILGTFENVNKELLGIVCNEWSHPYPQNEAHSVIKSSWDSGFAKPLTVLSVPDDPRELTTWRETVAWFNERFFITENYGNKTLVMWHEPDPNPQFKGHLVLGGQKQSDFSQRYNHLDIIVGYDRNGLPIKIPIVDCWLDYKWRAQYTHVIFAPGQELGERVKNLWQGFAVQARPGNCLLFLNFVRDIICSGVETHYTQLLNWMAYAVKHPDEPGYVAIVLRGSKGTGKNFFAQTFGYLWGSHYMAIVQRTQVTGRFNPHLQTCSVLFANEALFAGNRDDESTLKTYITDDQMIIEPKFVNPFKAPNYLHVIIAGNGDWLVRASGDERRFFFLDVSEGQMQNTSYFNPIKKQLENGGYEALLHTLLHRDLTGFDPRKAPPLTKGLYDQMIESLPLTERPWFECLYSGKIPGKMRTAPKDGSVELRASEFITWAKQRDPKWLIKEPSLGNLLGDDPRALRKPMGFKTERSGRNGRASRSSLRLLSAGSCGTSCGFRTTGHGIRASASTKSSNGNALILMFQTSEVWIKPGAA
jgi:uncharacterized protein DUF5906